jgi:hypothetical protein
MSLNLAIIESEHRASKKRVGSKKMQHAVQHNGRMRIASWKVRGDGASSCFLLTSYLLCASYSMHAFNTTGKMKELHKTLAYEIASSTSS